MESIPKDFFHLGDHLSRLVVAGQLVRSTRNSRQRAVARPEGLRPCVTLLPAGVAWQAHYCALRWSFTPPFHPCSRKSGHFLWPDPKGHPSRVLPGAVLYGVRTFLEPSKDGSRSPVQPGRFIIIGINRFVNTSFSCLFAYSLYQTTRKLSERTKSTSKGENRSFVKHLPTGDTRA